MLVTHNGDINGNAVRDRKYQLYRSQIKKSEKNDRISLSGDLQSQCQLQFFRNDILNF